MSNHDMQNMGKKVVALLAISTILLGCKGNGLIPEANDETLQNLDELFDSLLWQQYHSPEKTEKTFYEWKWAYDVREAIGVDDLDSLTTLSFELDSSYHSYAASPMAADMTTASIVSPARCCPMCRDLGTGLLRMPSIPFATSCLHRN